MLDGGDSLGSRAGLERVSPESSGKGAVPEANFTSYRVNVKLCIPYFECEHRACQAWGRPERVGAIGSARRAASRSVDTAPARAAPAPMDL